MADNAQSIEEIAIIGMSGAFPGARNIHELWKLLLEKRDGVVELSRERLIAAGEPESVIDSPSYVPRGGFIEGADAFDAAFFNIMAGEALVIDPQQRLFLTHSWLALEDSGYDPARMKGLVGVFAGQGIPEYWFLQKEAPESSHLTDYQLMLGNDKDFLATRVSYRLNLKGPSLSVQTACSSSLASVAVACQSLLAFNCDVALAGGVSITTRRDRGYLYYDGMIYSKTGACRPFDEKADGAAFGEGVGVVCLKRLSEAIQDGDYVYAVIKSAAMNNDGSGKAGFAAPSAEGQAEVIELAQALADVDARDIGYVEAHGTATALGDAVEVEALGKAFRGRGAGRGSCYLGSIKANIGHTDAAAGVAGLIKAALVVNTGTIPPQLRFERPNPRLGLEESPFLVNKEAVEMPLRGGRRLAGVSSFGVGGTNAHAILESPPKRPAAGTGRASFPLLLSAKSPESLETRKRELAAFLEENPGVDMGDAVAKISRPRHAFPFRWGVRAESAEGAAKALRAIALPPVPAGAPRALFAFPGQGSQFPAMARAYYGRLPTFSRWIDEGIGLSGRLGIPDLRRYLLEDGDEEALAETYLAQSLIYLVEYALARELIARGIEPGAVAGHSVGEYAAAAVAGAIGFEDGLRLVERRGYWMQRAPRGAMLAAALSADAAARYLSDETWLCLCNSPGQTVLGCAVEAIGDLEARLAADGAKFTRLKTSHAFHSPLMDGVLGNFAEEVRKVRFADPRIPFLSNADGSWLQAGCDWASYWPAQIRKPVRFDLCLEAIRKLPETQILEVGPGKALSGFALSAIELKRNPLPLLSSAKAEPGHFEDCLIRLWERGMPVKGLESDRAPATLALVPGYAFDAKRFWFDAGPGALAPRRRTENPPALIMARQVPAGGEPQADDGLRARIVSQWQRILGAPPPSDEASFFLSGGDSFSGILMADALRRELGIEFGMRDLLLNPSVSALVSRLRAGSAGGIEDPYVFPIQTSGAKPPLFMVAGAHQNRYHDPAAGNSYSEDFFRYFSNMIGALGTDQPLYGFKPKGLAKGEHYHTSVETMAAAFIASMRKVRPSGPYYIGGECVGGIVAYEMARQLEASGEEVGALILLDTPRPNAWSALKERLLIYKHSASSTLRSALRAFREGGIGPLAESVRIELQALRYALFPFTRERRVMRRALNGSERYERTLFKYRPDGGFKGRVALLMNRKWNKSSFMQGWRRDLGPILHFYEIPGTHDNRLKKNGQLVGRIIEKIISGRE